MAEGDLGLRVGRVRDIMRCMKRIRVTGCAVIAMLVMLSACSQLEQPGLSPAPGTPEGASPETELNPPAENSEKTEDASDKEENNAPAASQQGQQEHVCSGLLSCKLGLCPNGKKRRQQQTEAVADRQQQDKQTEEDTEDPAQIAETSAPEKTAPVTPSAEQMEAARALMAAQKENKKKPARRNETKTQTSTPEPAEDFVPEPAVVTNTSGIPGRSNLRMGHFAPPEEAASRGDKAAPRPNAAERHGLRSPSLPKMLPMDIDGQTHAH